jgi:hypothetical protein
MMMMEYYGEGNSDAIRCRLGSSKGNPMMNVYGLRVFLPPWDRFDGKSLLERIPQPPGSERLDPHREQDETIHTQTMKQGLGKVLVESFGSIHGF